MHEDYLALKDELDKYEEMYPEFMERARETAKLICRHNISAIILQPAGVYQHVVTIDMVRAVMGINTDPFSSTNNRNASIFRRKSGWERVTWLESTTKGSNGRPVGVWRWVG